MKFIQLSTKSTLNTSFCRLLNKSIIRVEQPDIHFGEDDNDAAMALQMEVYLKLLL